MSSRASHRSAADPLTAALAALFLLAGGCAAHSTASPPGTGEAAPEVSRSLAPFVYIEEGTDLVLTVGVRAAALREAEPFFPLEISIVNRQRDTTWVVTRESFALIDSDGNRYELPTHEELSRGYGKRTADNHLFDARMVTAGKHEGYRQVGSSFFPDPTLGIRRASDTPDDLSGVSERSLSLVPIERVELHGGFFLEDVLYFPHPAGKLVGERFSLEFRAAGLAEPARLAFEIPHVVGPKP
jgi:hypothetical protein